MALILTRAASARSSCVNPASARSCLSSAAKDGTEGSAKVFPFDVQTNSGSGTSAYGDIRHRARGRRGCTGAFIPERRSVVQLRRGQVGAADDDRDALAGRGLVRTGEQGR